MTKKKGKVYNRVAELLRARSMDPTGLEVVRLGAGSDYVVLMYGGPIGDYNHVSDRLVLYKDLGIKD